MSSRDRAVVEQLLERAQPHVDALGVVEPVHAEHQLAAGRPAPCGSPRPAASTSGRRDISSSAVESIEIGNAPSLTTRSPTTTSSRASRPRTPPNRRGQLAEVPGAAGGVEADQVRAQQPPHDLLAPRQLDEQLGGREGDVQEEPDPQVGAPLAEHARHELELVVLHPHRRALRRDLGGGRRRTAR